MRIKLIKPTLEHKAELQAYKEAFATIQCFSHGSPLADFATIEEGLAWINAPEGAVHPIHGSSKVANSTFIAWHLTQHRLIGFIDIRHTLNEPLFQIGGHIGYSIHPDFWGQGYGTEQLQLALLESDKLGIERVLITCNKENIGSRRVIEHCGGVLENEVENSESIIQRFWIEREI